MTDLFYKLRNYAIYSWWIIVEIVVGFVVITIPLVAAAAAMWVIGLSIATFAVLSFGWNVCFLLLIVVVLTAVAPPWAFPNLSWESRVVTPVLAIFLAIGLDLMVKA